MQSTLFTPRPNTLARDSVALLARRSWSASRALVLAVALSCGLLASLAPVSAQVSDGEPETSDEPIDVAVPELASEQQVADDRKQLDALTNWVKRSQIGMQGLVYCKFNEDGTTKSSIEIVEIDNLINLV